MYLIFRSFDVIFRVKSTDFNQISARPDSRTRESRTFVSALHIGLVGHFERSTMVWVWNWNSTFKCTVVSSDNITSNPICVTFVYQSGTKGFVDRWIHEMHGFQLVCVALVHSTPIPKWHHRHFTSAVFL